MERVAKSYIKNDDFDKLVTYKSTNTNFNEYTFENFEITKYAVAEMKSGGIHPAGKSMTDTSMVNFNDERLYIFGGE